MHQHGTKIQWAGRQTRNKRAERVYELIAANIDRDFWAVAIFALLGLALSLSVLHGAPLTAEGLDLLTPGS
jgi:hypothetical protein